MTADDKEGVADRSLEQRVSSEIRQEAEGRSDAFVYENYEDAASLLRSAAHRYDELTSQEGRSDRHTQEIAKANTDLREREAAWKAWSDLAEERNQAADLAEERRLDPLERNDSAARNGAADRTENVIYGDSDREKVLAQAMAESASKQNNLEPAPHDRARELAADFREMSQDQRLQDTRTNSAAKQLAAIDVMIDRKYGHGTPEADRMKDAAREAVAQTLESGKDIRPPRLRAAEKEVELRRDDRQRAADAADRTAKDLER